jgi:hypothetical protein
MLVGHVFRVERSKNQGGLFMPRGAASVGVAFAPAHTLRQDLVSVSFFPSEWSARQFYVALNAVLVKRHIRWMVQQRRNVVAVSNTSNDRAVVRSIVLTCLRAGSGS